MNYIEKTENYIENTEQDAKDIASTLLDKGVLVFSFTDGSTHYDVLMAHKEDYIDQPINADKLKDIRKKYDKLKKEVGEDVAHVSDDELDYMALKEYYAEYKMLLQRGIKKDDLFVCVMSCGAFGFGVKGEEGKIPLHRNYIGEKLNLGVDNTTEQLTQLISNVRAELRKNYEDTV